MVEGRARLLRPVSAPQKNRLENSLPPLTHPWVDADCMHCEFHFYPGAGGRRWRRQFECFADHDSS